MCNYNIEEQCFHPEKVPKGLVALPCDVHNCTQCTNKEWQKTQQKQDTKYLRLLEQTIQSMKITK